MKRYLSLQDICGNDFTSVAVKERQSCAERRGGDTPEDSLGDNASPAWLSLVDGFVEEVVEEQRFKFAILGVSSSDITKENTLDDATTSPHLSNA